VSIEVSVVVPVMNEEENILPLLRETVDALKDESLEVIFVDDASTDATHGLLVGAKTEFSMLRVLRHDINCGQSSSIRTGILAATGQIIAVMDGDGQNDPADFPALLSTYRATSATTSLKMVQGHRQKRQDSSGKKFASRVGNGIRQKLIRDRSPDTGCGIKVFSREVFLKLPYFDHMHRYMAGFILREGYEVDFVPVNHRARVHGSSKYGILDRLWVSISDLFGVMWLQRRGRLPGDVSEK
jgi:glycosyltransferase involved in cell wall biosynthesis